MPTIAIAFLTADESSLLRVNKSNFPQSIQMELLVQGLNDRNLFCDEDGSFLEVESWAEVEVKESCIESIDWSTFIGAFFPGGGTIALDWIPDTVRVFEVWTNALEGTLNTRLLPNALRYFDVSENKLSGKVELHQLPPNVTYFDICRNMFSGEVCLKRFPKNLDFLDMAHNMFSGSVSLLHFPPNLKFIRMHDNRFHGDVYVDDTVKGTCVNLAECEIERVVHIEGKEQFESNIQIREEN